MDGKNSVTAKAHSPVEFQLKEIQLPHSVMPTGV